MTAHNLFGYEKLGETVNKSMILDTTDTLKAIDLFAGIGGIRTGFSNIFGSNIDFVFSSEIDKNAQKTYYLNYNEVPYGDITSHNIILAGFLCQAFSVSG